MKDLNISLQAIETLKEITIKELTHNLHISTFRNKDLFEVYSYAIFPPGKLFRPLIFKLFYLDLLESNNRYDIFNIDSLNNNQNVSLISSALEIHHVYTLLHDDLPSMDDDDKRRGKDSCHIYFDEWKALLAGDGLHAMSYFLLSQIDPKYVPMLLKVFAKNLGAKGLIRGQCLDLSGLINIDLKTLLETHFLKTGKLIQTSLLCALILSEKFSYKNIKETLRIGKSIGIIFQLIDDLLELKDKINIHEININPWIQNSLEISKILNKSIGSLKLILCKHSNLMFYIKGNYLSKMLSTLDSNSEKIANTIFKYNSSQDLKQIKESLKSIILALQKV